MVTIKFRTFEEFKQYITGLGPANPNVAAPNRFHTVSGNGTVGKIAHIYAGGQIILLYTSPVGEEILPDDSWFAANKEMEYDPSIVVADIGESIT